MNRVYIAGPYTASTPDGVLANVNRALDAGIELIKRGYTPYIPHLTHFLELRSQETGAGLEYEDYLLIDLEWLGQCDALLYLAPSPGADRELTFAQAQGLMIYRAVEEIPVARVPV